MKRYFLALLMLLTTLSANCVKRYEFTGRRGMFYRLGNDGNVSEIYLQCSDYEFYVSVEPIPGKGNWRITDYSCKNLNGENIDCSSDRDLLDQAVTIARKYYQGIN